MLTPPQKVFDIALCLRALVTGTDKGGGRLIFRCAEELGVVPVCYVAPACEQGDAKLPIMDSKTIYLFNEASAFPIEKVGAEVAFEKWLLRTALKTERLDIKHWELIRAVAGKFGAHGEGQGSHFIFSFVNPHEDFHLDIGFLVNHFRKYGHLTLELCKRLPDRTSIS